MCRRMHLMRGSRLQARNSALTRASKMAEALKYSERNAPGSLATKSVKRRNAFRTGRESLAKKEPVAIRKQQPITGMPCVAIQQFAVDSAGVMPACAPDRQPRPQQLQTSLRSPD